MGPTAFERESYVPVCSSPTFVCTSKGSKIQRVSVFARYPYKTDLANFQDIEMRLMAFERESFVSVSISPFAVGSISISWKWAKFAI